MEQQTTPIGVRLKWLGCACFEMEFGGLTVVNDPWITGNQATELTWEAVEKCNYITLTHGHFDHTLDIPKLVEKFDADVLCGDGIAPTLLRWADLNPMRLYPMPADLELDFDDVKIKALYGRHVFLPGKAAERAARARMSPYNEGNPDLIEMAFWGDLEFRNYLFTTNNGTKLLLWGNKLRPDQKNILRREKPDVAIVQVTGANPPEEMAKLLQEIGCKVVIPYHFDFPKDYTHKIKEFGEALANIAPEIQYIIPDYNQWIAL